MGRPNPGRLAVDVARVQRLLDLVPSVPIPVRARTSCTPATCGAPPHYSRGCLKRSSTPSLKCRTTVHARDCFYSSRRNAALVSVRLSAETDRISCFPAREQLPLKLRTGCSSMPFGARYSSAGSCRPQYPTPVKTTFPLSRTILDVGIRPQAESSSWRASRMRSCFNDEPMQLAAGNSATIVRRG
jgi:hypothetical protein